MAFDAFAVPSKAEKLHFHYMQMALSQSKRAPKRPTNFRVGAVLVDSRRLPPGILDIDQKDLDDFPKFGDSKTERDAADNEDDFDPNSAVVATGYTGELSGNTHAEECAIEKYARECRGDGGSGKNKGQVPELSEDEFEIGDLDEGLAPNEVLLEDDLADQNRPSIVTSPLSSRPRKLSLSSPAGDAGLPYSASPPTITTPDLLIYTTLEPCSLRLSGREPCVSRIINTRFEEEITPEVLAAHHRRYSRTVVPGTESPSAEPEMPADMNAAEDLHLHRHRRRKGRPLQRRISHVFVGVTEPPTFVEKNSGKESFLEEGIRYTVVPGLEEKILKIASAGHEAVDS